jgi:hypothetical protein
VIPKASDNINSCLVFLRKLVRAGVKGEALELDEFHWLEPADSTAQAPHSCACAVEELGCSQCRYASKSFGQSTWLCRSSCTLNKICVKDGRQLLFPIVNH